jgi:3-methyladenine DNA glycosylase AlkD
LIHKVVGWILREVGKRNIKAEAFFKRYASIMHRTMLRYAIEKFPKAKREYYMKMKDLLK